MSLNLVPWNDDTHLEVRMFRNGVNTYTGISFDKTQQGWRLNLNEEYEPARKIVERTGLNGMYFKYFTAGFNRVEQELRSYAQ